MVVIRPGTRVDVDPGVAVWRDAYRVSHGDPDDALATRVRDFLGELESFLVVADDETAIIGMAVGTQGRGDDGTGGPVPGLMHLAMLVVAPDRWGHGLGGALLDTVLAEGRRREYEQVEAWAHVDDTRIGRLYESRHFEPSGRRREDAAGDPITQYRRSLAGLTP